MRRFALQVLLCAAVAACCPGTARGALNVSAAHEAEESAKSSAEKKMAELQTYVGQLHHQAKDSEHVQVVAFQVFHEALAKVEQQRLKLESDVDAKKDALRNVSAEANLTEAIKLAGSLEKAIEKDVVQLKHIGLQTRIGAILEAYYTAQQKERRKAAALSHGAAMAYREYLKAAHATEAAERAAGAGQDAAEQEFQTVQDMAERKEDEAQDKRDEADDAIEELYNQVEQLIDHRMDIYKDVWAQATNKGEQITV